MHVLQHYETNGGARTNTGLQVSLVSATVVVSFKLGVLLNRLHPLLVVDLKLPHTDLLRPFLVHVHDLHSHSAARRGAARHGTAVGAGLLGVSELLQRETESRGRHSQRNDAARHSSAARTTSKKFEEVRLMRSFLSCSKSIIVSTMLRCCACRGTQQAAR